MKTINFSDPIIGFILKTIASIIGVIFLFIARRAVNFLDSIDKRLGSIETKMEIMTTRYDAMEKRVSRLEEAVYEK